jgi:hypothetical protein
VSAAIVCHIVGCRTMRMLWYVVDDDDRLLVVICGARDGCILNSIVENFIGRVGLVVGFMVGFMV